MQTTFRAITCFTIALLVGCGGKTSEGFSGTVSVQGKPLAGVTVLLIPESGAQEGRLVGASDKEGKFTVLPASGGKAIPGNFKVVVTDPSAVWVGGGKKVSDLRADDPYNADQKPVQNPPIPPIFTSEKTTSSKVVVVSGKPIIIDLN